MDKDNKCSYFSQENGVYVLLESDYPLESYDEDKYSGFFEFNNKMTKVIK